MGVGMGRYPDICGAMEWGEARGPGEGTEGWDGGRRGNGVAGNVALYRWGGGCAKEERER